MTEEEEKSEEEVFRATDRMVKVLNINDFEDLDDAVIGIEIGDFLHYPDRNKLLIFKGKRHFRHFSNDGLIKLKITDHMIDTLKQLAPLLSHSFTKGFTVCFQVSPFDKCIKRLFGCEALPQWKHITLQTSEGKTTIADIDFGNGMRLANFYTSTKTGKMLQSLRPDFGVDIIDAVTVYWATCGDVIAYSAKFEIYLETVENDEESSDDEEFEELGKALKNARLSNEWAFNYRTRLRTKTNPVVCDTIMWGDRKTFSYEKAFDKLKNLSFKNAKLLCFTLHCELQPTKFNRGKSSNYFFPKLHSVCSTPCAWSAYEWQWRNRREILIKYFLGLVELQLPIYVMYWIIQWLPDLVHSRRYQKIALLEGLLKSTIKVKAQRNQNKDIKL